MKQQKKLQWIKRVSPFLYDIALAAVCIYLTVRISVWADLILPFGVGAAVGLFFLLAYVLNLLTVNGVPCTKNKFCAYSVGISVFVILYLFMTNILSDICQAVLRLFIRNTEVLRLVAVWCGFACIFLTLLAVFGGMKHAKSLVTVRYASACPKMKRSLRAVLLSDLHIGYFVGMKHIRNIVSRVNLLHPDIVLISGDIINAGLTHECPQIENVADLLSKLSSEKGTFAVVGNHDPSASDPAFRQFLQRAHIRLLDDEVFSDQDIQIVGRTTRTKPRKALAALMAGLNREMPIIVLDHDPIGIREAAEEKADYVLCGHTHKGQIFPLGLFVRFLYRRDEIWGMAKQGSTVSIVSAGAGFFSVPMRVCSDSEIVLLEMGRI